MSLSRLLVVVCLAFAAGSPALLRGQSGAFQPLTGEGAEDLSASGLASVRVDAERKELYVLQPVRLRVRVGVESELRGRLLQLFQHELDFPLQLDLPWIDGVPGSFEVSAAPDSAAGAASASFALHDRIARAQLAPQGVGVGRNELELELVYVPLRAGVQELPPPALRFAYATSFEEDLLRGRVARDRREAFVRGAPLALEAKALPEEGRPADFSGAVGSFTVHAQVARRALEVGEPFELELRVEGEGNLGAFQPPRIDDARVRTLGVAAGAGARTFVYSLAVREPSLERLPALSLSYFDPAEPAGYRRAQTQPIALEVRAAKPAPGPPVGPWEPVDESPSPTALVLASVGVALAVLVLGSRLRRRARVQRELAARSDRAEAFLQRVHAAPLAAEGLLAAISGHWGWPPAALVTSDLGARLVQSGVEQELAARAQRFVDAWMAARFGGSIPAERGEILALAEDFARAIRDAKA